jgi:hypothetical protein
MKKIFETVAISLLCASAWGSLVPSYDAENGHYYEVVYAPGTGWMNAEQYALNYVL